MGTSGRVLSGCGDIWKSVEGAVGTSGRVLRGCGDIWKSAEGLWGHLEEC